MSDETSVKEPTPEVPEQELESFFTDEEKEKIGQMLQVYPIFNQRLQQLNAATANLKYLKQEASILAQELDPRIEEEYNQMAATVKKVVAEFILE